MTGEAAAMLSQARELGLRIAVAESLTGGLLSSELVEVAGASAVFSGAVVAYDTSLKSSLLHVDAELLQEHGPVHPEVARQMARGVRHACAVRRGSSPLVSADVGIATTGVAGPDPDSQTGQTAGTVWLGVSSCLGERAVSLSIHGDRVAVRTATVVSAIGALQEEILALKDVV